MSSVVSTAPARTHTARAVSTWDETPGLAARRHTVTRSRTVTRPTTCTRRVGRSHSGCNCKVLDEILKVECKGQSKTGYARNRSTLTQLRKRNEKRANRRRARRRAVPSCRAVWESVESPAGAAQPHAPRRAGGRACCNRPMRGGHDRGTPGGHARRRGPAGTPGGHVAGGERARREGTLVTWRAHWEGTPGGKGTPGGH